MASGKTVILITGANSGIGYETVIALATASANFHVIIGSRTTEKGQKAMEVIQVAHSLKGTVSVVPVDVTDRQSVEAAKEQVESRFGKLDVLINNAGIIAYQEPDMERALRLSFETNVFGQLRMTDTFEPLLRRSARPLVVYISSAQGSVTKRLDASYDHVNLRADHYRVSKAALNMLAACHRHNFAEWGCKVIAFNPAWCVSNLTGEKGREMRAKMGARDPKEPASSLAEIVLGKRDADLEKNGMVDLDGGVIPW
ncbi:putative short chain dehydrogenase/reductase [Xylariomycetidae sp. FL2044]|nr:putative short chain dehydrogenase/reductase [Xylariomycetidae sp. FL2044]